MKPCIVDGCNNEAKQARGYCYKHYERWRRHGDPSVVLKPGEGAAQRNTIDYCQGCNKILGLRKTNRWKWCDTCRPNSRGNPRFWLTRTEIHCLECNTNFLPKDPRSRFCSNACGERHRGSNKRRRIRPVLVCQWCGKKRYTTSGTNRPPYCRRCAPLLKSPLRESPLPWHQCPICDRWYIRRGRRSRFCSNQCYLKDQSPKIMGLYRQALALPDVKKAMAWWYKLVAYLADRDGRRCYCGQLINLKLPSGLRGNPMGPSIDHVIPRSRGGTDDLANLRLTHWKCNQARGNRGGGEQLKLVG